MSSKGVSSKLFETLSLDRTPSDEPASKLLEEPRTLALALTSDGLQKWPRKARATSNGQETTYNPDCAA
jgi:hypothetical protein